MWAGKVSARHIVVLTGQLTANPHSRVFALAGKNPELQGWDTATAIAARTHNLIAGLLAGLAKGVDLDAVLITYPSADEPDAEPTQQSLADFIRTHIDGGVLEDFFTP
ncbi:MULTISPECIES: hypothetical protein [Microbacterium]|uniref:hypothetical protein n=1 Tax=Microbacterium TaxID=33882 RepID=UPI000DF7B5A9|nr:MULTISPECIES: hypothetical protein [Microbacterium]MCZ4066427.1 hypothetical protein [Microbacterium sp. H37-C3]